MEISTFPHTLVSPVNDMTPSSITVVLDETDDGWTISVKECCYQLTVYKKGSCDDDAERLKDVGRLQWNAAINSNFKGKCSK